MEFPISFDKHFSMHFYKRLYYYVSSISLPTPKSITDRFALDLDGKIKPIKSVQFGLKK